MNEELTQLATRAIACKHWRWMPGMQCIDTWYIPARVIHVDTDYDPPAIAMAWSWHKTDGGIHPRGLLPDLTDAATLGCVERLACEAWGADCITIRTSIAPDMSGPRAWWSARSYRGHRHAGGDVRSRHVRAACLIAALEAAS